MQGPSHQVGASVPSASPSVVQPHPRLLATEGRGALGPPCTLLPLPGRASLATTPCPNLQGVHCLYCHLKSVTAVHSCPVPLAPQSHGGSVLRTRRPHPGLQLPGPAPESGAGPPALSSEVTQCNLQMSQEQEPSVLHVLPRALLSPSSGGLPAPAAPGRGGRSPERLEALGV